MVIINIKDSLHEILPFKNSPAITEVWSIDDVNQYCIERMNEYEMIAVQRLVVERRGSKTIISDIAFTVSREYELISDFIEENENITTRELGELIWSRREDYGKRHSDYDDDYAVYEYDVCTDVLARLMRSPDYLKEPIEYMKFHNGGDEIDV